jgi:hypothetical protein
LRICSGSHLELLLILSIVAVLKPSLIIEDY